MPKLPIELRQMIDSLCQKGDRFAQIDQLDDALDQYDAAWDLLPVPKNQWPAATWILMAAGDVYFERREFNASIDALIEALDCPDGANNPFIHLRLGQGLFEIGDLQGASKSFETAIQLSGEEILVDEDPKYLSFVRTHMGMNRYPSATSRRFQRPL